MFAKILRQPCANIESTTSCSLFACKKRIRMFSTKMKRFRFCRFQTIEVPVGGNRKSHSITKSHVFDLKFTRSFLQFNGSLTGRHKEYQGKKLVGYSSGQMFDVVADVEKYQDFLPFCKRSHVSFKSSTNIRADLVIGFPPLVERYTSNVSLVRPQLIKASCTDGKLFDHLLTTWKFSPGLKNNVNTCIIDFFVSFEFKSALHSHLANLFFNELVWQMERAFYEEAKNRYGDPVVKMQALGVSQKNS